MESSSRMSPARWSSSTGDSRRCGTPAKLMASWSSEESLAAAMGRTVDPAAFIASVTRLRSNRTEYCHDEIALRDKRTFEGYSTPMLDATGHYLGRAWYYRDITERKRDERHEHLSSEILQILNEPIATVDAVYRILAAIKRETDFDAVGIRLRSGSDFPYYAQDGFAQDFLLTENTLIPKGAPVRECLDKAGNLRLACTCGMVLQQSGSTRNPALTDGGSFWTNNSLPLLDLPPEEDLRFRPRNRCITSGYRSLALVPIRANNEVVGLLQLNDRRCDCFTLDHIRFFESIGASIGTALMRQQHVDALREGEANFRTFFESVTDMVLGIDLNGNIVLANPAVTRVLGYSPTELIGKAVLELHPNSCRQEAEEIHAAIFRGKRRNCPLPFVTKAGNIVSVETRNGLGRWNGMPCMFAISRDLTAEQEVLERFEQIFRKNPLQMALTDLPDRRYVDVNDAFERATGYSRAEVTGKTSVELGLLGEAARAAVGERLRSEGRVRDLELPIPHRDGTTHTGLCSAEVVHVRGQPHLLNVMMDITDRKRADAELREKREQLGMALAAARMGVWHWDIPSDTRRYDDQTCRLLGIDPRAFRGTGEEVFSLIHHEDVGRVRAALEKTRNDGAPLETSYRARWSDGTLHHLVARGRLVKEDSPRIDGIIWDETDRAQAQQALHASEARFQQLAEVFPETIFEADVTGRILYANAHGFRMYGATQADLDRGLNLLDLVVPEDRSRALQRLQDRLAHKATGFIEVRARRLDGTELTPCPFRHP